MFVPWAIYSLSCIYFYMVILSDGFHETDSEVEKVSEYIVSLIICITLLYMLYIEMI